MKSSNVRCLLDIEFACAGGWRIDVQQYRLRSWYVGLLGSVRNCQSLSNLFHLIQVRPEVIVRGRRK